MEWIDYDERWSLVLKVDSTLYIYADAHKEYYIGQWFNPVLDTTGGWKYRVVTWSEYLMIKKLVGWLEVGKLAYEQFKILRG